MHFKNSALAAAGLLGSAIAFPVTDSYGAAQDDNSYRAPGPNDSRSPCPGLNTLANHGFLPRNGRNVTKDMINTGFLNGFGMDSSTSQLAMDNAFAVCSYVMGSPCSLLPNLTLLAEPHTLEHDHSFSRQDYHMAWAGPKKFVNNQNFNATIFDTSVGALKGADHMDYAGANMVRLTRESIAFQQDLPGWFLSDPIVQGVELGFIFGTMSDPTLADFSTNPKVRVDWWRYWTVNESFPTPLGWKKPDPPRNSNFVFSVSSAIYHNSASTTPTPRAPATQSQKDVVLATTKYTTVNPVPTDAPYVAPDAAFLHKRAEEEAVLAKREVVRRALEAAPPAPTVNPYKEALSPQEWASVAAVRKQRFEIAQAALQAAAP